MDNANAPDSNKPAAAEDPANQSGQTPPAQPGGGSGVPQAPTTANGGGRVVVVPSGSGTSSTVSAERKVDNLLRQLFRGPVPEKPAELKERLNQIIQPKRTDQKRVAEYEYSPTNIAIVPVVGQSVAQTSLAGRAQAARRDAEQRLNELRPMGAPADPESISALRSVTLVTYKRLVKELGEGGGPRNKRAEKLFDALIGPEPHKPKILHPDSLLGKIEKEFKLAGADVRSNEDNANLASFRIVRDNLFTLYSSWTDFKVEEKQDFGRRSAKFSRDLEAIEADVNDVETALEAAGHDTTDRAIETIKSEDAEELTVGGLLSWVREFASEEAPELVDTGGKVGFGALIPTLKELAKLIEALIAHVTENVKPNENAISALAALKKHLKEAVTDAEDAIKS